MVRVLIITLCVVLDIWLLHQIWVAEKNKRKTNEKLLWTITTLLFHVAAVAVYIFLDTTGTEDKDDKSLNE